MILVGDLHTGFLALQLFLLNPHSSLGTNICNNTLTLNVSFCSCISFFAIHFVFLSVVPSYDGVILEFFGSSLLCDLAALDAVSSFLGFVLFVPFSCPLVPFRVKILRSYYPYSIDRMLADRCIASARQMKEEDKVCIKPP
jgi:hypothetical protein